LRYDATGWSGPPLALGWSPGYLTAGNVSRLSPLEVDEGRLSPGATAPRATDPARQAALAFRAALRTLGVPVRGQVLAGTAPAAGLGIAAVESAPIPALVQRMLTDSDNDLAEALGRLLARQAGLPATFTGAAAAVTAAVRDLGVPTAGLRLYDASGLSRDDRVTPRSLVAVLRLAADGEPDLAPILAGLPVAGFTGTLADRYRADATNSAAGLARAKTGTLAGVSALAGQVVDADGRLLVFAFLADHVPLPTPAEDVLDRLATALAACGCPRAQ
jgi:D-alanyl-D-alanine carboxypeptidase/D-alanyl-D-alanine-endopeptidase (penicillin-binding protein 4)